MLSKKKKTKLEEIFSQSKEFFEREFPGEYICIRFEYWFDTQEYEVQITRENPVVICENKIRTFFDDTFGIKTIKFNDL